MAPALTIRLSTIEHWAAAFTTLWGLWVLSWGPGQAIGAAAFADLRASISVFGGQPWQVVGLGGLLIGTIWNVAIYINGRGIMWTPIVRCFAASLNVLFFAHVARSIILAQPSSTGVFTYAAVALIYTSLVAMNASRAAHSFSLLVRSASWAVKR